MGQYWIIANLSRKEFLDPSAFQPDGRKLMEFTLAGEGGAMTALGMLLACSNGAGGGDLDGESQWFGAWAGDSIALVGDYAEDADLPGHHAEGLYDRAFAQQDDWKNVSGPVKEALWVAAQITYDGRKRTCRY